MKLPGWGWSEAPFWLPVPSLRVGQLPTDGLWFPCPAKGSIVVWAGAATAHPALPGLEHAGESQVSLEGQPSVPCHHDSGQGLGLSLPSFVPWQGLSQVPPALQAPAAKPLVLSLPCTMDCMDPRDGRRLHVGTRQGQLCRTQALPPCNCPCMGGAARGVTVPSSPGDTAEAAAGVILQPPSALPTRRVLPWGSGSLVPQDTASHTPHPWALWGWCRPDSQLCPLHFSGTRRAGPAVRSSCGPPRWMQAASPCTSGPQASAAHPSSTGSCT